MIDRGFLTENDLMLGNGQPDGPSVFFAFPRRTLVLGAASSRRRRPAARRRGAGSRRRPSATTRNTTWGVSTAPSAQDSKVVHTAQQLFAASDVLGEI